MALRKTVQQKGPARDKVEADVRSALAEAMDTSPDRILLSSALFDCSGDLRRALQARGYENCDLRFSPSTTGVQVVNQILAIR